MVNHISKIVSHFFQKDSLDAISENELRYFITQYPYVGTGHFLLAKKLQMAGEKRAFDREVAVTSVYFTNPAWLEFILRQEVSVGSVNGAEHKTLTVSDLADIRAADADPVEDVSVGPAESQEPVLSYTQQFVVVESPSEPPVAEAAPYVAGSDLVDHQMIEEDLPPVQEKSDLSPQVGSAEAFEDTDPLNTHQTGKPFSTGGDDGGTADEIAAANAAVLLESEAIAETVDQNAAETAEILLEAEATAEQVDESAAETAEILLAAEATAEHVNENAAETADTLLNAESDEALRHIARVGAEAVRTAAGGDSGKLAFDPYHTIDYFASQGIKLKLDDLNKDKLGQQLKSFTEWIRSMKRLPAQVTENVNDDQDQQSIRKIAEHSVEGKEVLTESMAEVWAKQGNYDKARQIYQKLSLQNPSKSTYFAAKINQLKAL